MLHRAYKDCGGDSHGVIPVTGPPYKDSSSDRKQCRIWGLGFAWPGTRIL